MVHVTKAELPDYLINSKAFIRAYTKQKKAAAYHDKEWLSKKALELVKTMKISYTDAAFVVGITKQAVSLYAKNHGFVKPKKVKK